MLVEGGQGGQAKRGANRSAGVAQMRKQFQREKTASTMSATRPIETTSKFPMLFSWLAIQFANEPVATLYDPALF
jgi:hypothetical protein